MRTITAGTFLDALRETHGESGAEDAFYLWLEEVVGAVRENRWPWNWTRTNSICLASVTESDCTWNAGDDYITTAAAASIGYDATGRIVEIDDEFYEVVDVGLTNANRIYVDRPIAHTQVDAIDLVFYRADICVRTNKIRNVRVGDVKKLARYDAGRMMQTRFGNEFETYSPGTPAGYIDYDGDALRRPKFPPVVATTGGPNAQTSGKYRFFYTRYCPETGRESAPGPAVTVDITDGFEHTIRYNNPTTLDQSEWSTYRLRLYCSEVDVSRDRAPMFLIAERGPAAPGSPSVTIDPSSNGRLYEQERYWSGMKVRVKMLPPPDDDDTRAIQIDHVDSWGYHIHPDDEIALGTDNQVVDLVRIYMAGVIGSAARSPQEHRAALATFRSQMTYLLGKAESSGEQDEGPHNMEIVNPHSDPYYSDAWVDHMRWPGE